MSEGLENKRTGKIRSKNMRIHSKTYACSFCTDPRATVVLL